MKKITLLKIDRQYKNNGQHCEQRLIYTLSGEMRKADNKPYTVGGDYGDIQIKSARATICKGTDLIKHLEEDGANRYAYVIDELDIAYLMNTAEYFDFCMNFGYITRESSKNGGAEKIALKWESKALLQWLADRV